MHLVEKSLHLVPTFVAREAFVWERVGGAALEAVWVGSDSGDKGLQSASAFAFLVANKPNAPAANLLT